MDLFLGQLKNRTLILLRANVALIATMLLLTSCGMPRPTQDERTRPKFPSSRDASSDALPQWAEATYELCGAKAQLEPYSSRTFKVSAASYGTNSNLYVQPGDLIEVRAGGKWTIWSGETDPHTADGLEVLGRVNNCPKGALVAHVGDFYKEVPICVGSSGKFSATNAGLVYFAMNDESSPLFHGGSVDVTVSSSGIYAPTLSPENLTTETLCKVGSPTVELLSSLHHSFIVPTAVLMRDYGHAGETLMFFDNAYEDLSELSDFNLPYGGQRIRWIADEEIRAYGWLVGGNPIRYDPKNLDGEAPARTMLLRSSAPDMTLWDFYLGLGHSFSRVLGTRFHADLASSRAWSKLFATFAMQSAGRQDSRMPKCDGISLQQADDSDIKACLLYDLQSTHGWGLISQFYNRVANVGNWDLVLAADATAAAKWDWFEDTVNDLTGVDNGPIFRRYDAYISK